MADDDTPEDKTTLGLLLRQGKGRGDIAQHISDLEIRLDQARANAKRWEDAYYEALKTAPTVGDAPTDEVLMKDRTRFMQRELKRALVYADDANQAMAAAFRITGNPLTRKRPSWWARRRQWRRLLP